MKGDSGLNTYGSNNQLHYKNVQTESVPRLPHDVMDTTTLSQTTMSEYGYRRYIYRASASHWRPVSTIASIGFPGGVDNFSEGSTDIEILQDNNVSGSFPINAAGKYQYLSTVTTGSGHLFSGSMLPAGELFNLKFSDIGTVISSSYLTDVRISDSDPTSVNPFQQVLSTGSADFITWYGGLKESASLYDTNNIHSLVNNLPAFIITDCDNDHSVMMKFVDMMGEYYDLLRCYIDNYTSFVKPGYSGTDIAPANVLSQLAADKDWEFIMPFTGSLVEHLGGNFSKSETTKDRTDSTFRKVYNSLISIYKSKGSLKGIRSLLNAYGMPPEVLKLREHGGSLDAHDLGILSSDTSNILDGVSLATGSISYEKKFDTLYSYMFNSDPKRTIGLDWHMNSAGITDMSGSSGAECIEFIVKPAESSIPQTILKSSGSANESFWDLRIVPSASADEYGFLEFRLNHSTESYVGHAGTISSSLKTPALGFKTNEFWNVMLFKTSQSYDTDVSQTYYQETSSYYLAVGRGTGDKIRDFNVISMSVDTPLANMAWACTGSHGIGGRTAAENLRVGETLTGSLSEIKLWKTPISFSRFKQHILDPKSSVGNSLLSAQNDLVYHYRLNENWQHDATTPKIFDANPNNGVDYTRNINTSVFDTGSILYDMTDIERTVFGLRTDGNEMANDNNIIINPVEKSIGNLDPKRASKLSQFDTLEKKRTASTVVEIVKSPQDVINDFIINALGDFDINDYFASAQNLEDQEYTELNKLQKDFLDHFDISLDVNKYIRAQAAIFNKSLIESIKKLLPARATLDTVGIELKDTFLNREKLPQPKISQEFTRPEDDIPVIEPIETGEYSDTKTEIIYEQQIESTQGIYETDLDSWRAVPSQESGTLSAEQIQIEALPFDYRVDGVTSNALGTEPYECEVRGDDMKCFPGNQFREPHLDQGISTNKTGSVRFPGPGDANTVTPAGEGQDSYGYETRYIFPTIGDVEVVSASNDVTSGQTPHTDFTGEKHFKNNQTDNTLSPSLGHRPIGTTARFFNSNQASASGIEAYKRGKRLDDTYIYPANHIYIVGSSKDAFDNLFYKGTQNGLDGQGNQEVDGRTMEMDGNTDLSSASFYRVNVTGENILKVNRGEK
jgi:hypothetical protein